MRSKDRERSRDQGRERQFLPGQPSSNQSFPPESHTQRAPVPQGSNAEPPLLSTLFDFEKISYCSEDIILCVDVDREIESEMKSVTARGGPSHLRIEAVRQALVLFVHSKLAMNPSHRFAVATLAETPSWSLKNFTSDVNSIVNAIKGIQATGDYDRCNLYSVLRLAAQCAPISTAQGRHTRLVLVYSRSNVIPHMPQPWDILRKLTVDAIYLHEKPSVQNRPQAIFDVLVSHLEAATTKEAFIFETSSHLAKQLFRTMCLLLVHPWQRCEQDDLCLPQDLGKLMDAPMTSNLAVITRQGSQQ